jgi:acyl-CoA reductase-like NAD-dependent aldehyde dehydrogenase
MNPRAFLLDGRPVTTSETAEVRNPYNGELVAEVCVAGEKDVARALDIAAGAFEEARHLPSIERSRLLRRIDRCFRL